MFTMDVINDSDYKSPLIKGRKSTNCLDKSVHINNNIPRPISVNWHFWPYCNYRCTFCFSHFEQLRRPLSLDKMKTVLSLLARAGTNKITFVGGEPTLCPYLGDVLVATKSLGMTTMIVSNGTGITSSFLDQFHEFIDWIGLSIDSCSEHTQLKLGRGSGNHVQRTIERAHLIKNFEIKLKINTVITRLNLHEDFHPLLATLTPHRWKVFQILRITGQNELTFSELQIIHDEFLEFISRHTDLHPVSESSEDMKDSYLMIDPLGRFFQNTNNTLGFSDSILELGVMESIKQIGWNSTKFLERGGKYEW